MAGSRTCSVAKVQLKSQASPRKRKRNPVKAATAAARVDAMAAVAAGANVPSAVKACKVKAAAAVARLAKPVATKSKVTHAPPGASVADAVRSRAVKPAKP